MQSFQLARARRAEPSNWDLLNIKDLMYVFLLEVVWKFTHLKGQKDVSVLSNSECSSRGPRFKSHHPYGSSPLPLPIWTGSPFPSRSSGFTKCYKLISIIADSIVFLANSGSSLTSSSSNVYPHRHIRAVLFHTHPPFKPFHCTLQTFEIPLPCADLKVSGLWLSIHSSLWTFVQFCFKH